MPRPSRPFRGERQVSSRTRPGGRVPRRALLALLLPFAGVPVPAAAQESRTHTAEWLIGYGAGTASGRYRETIHLALDFVLARRYGREAAIAPMVALDFGGQAPFGAVSDVCIFAPREPSGCVQLYPAFFSIGVLGGLEARTASLRVSAGPAYVHARLDGRDHEAANTVGLQARTQLGAGALVFSIRGMFVPSYRSDSFWLIAYQIGLRAR